MRLCIQIKLRITKHLLTLCGFAMILFYAEANADNQRWLSWSNLDVSARLEQDGSLLVHERHTIVFNGDWNGGYRSFRIKSSQHLTHLAIARIDSVTGDLIWLHRGDLSDIDSYEWDGKQLRWRSRLPSDPPFKVTTLVYEIVYSMSNILVPSQTEYLLDHDFGMPDSPGIRDFSLNLELDPAWQPLVTFTGTTRHQLTSGQHVVVTLPLRYVGQGQPAKAGWLVVPMTEQDLHAIYWALLFFLLWRALRWLRHEYRLGHFEPLPPEETITEVWLADQVFRFKPELIGAIWDKQTGSTEVAAQIARLVTEGKLVSRVESLNDTYRVRKVLHLKLCCPRDNFSTDERWLIDAIFFDGDETDTDSIREHYRNSGFDPAKRAKLTMQRYMDHMARTGSRLATPTAQLTTVLLLASATLLAVGFWRYISTNGLVEFVFAMSAIFVVIWAASRLGAESFVRNVTHPVIASIKGFSGIVAMVVMLGFLLTPSFALPPLFAIGLTLLVSAAVNSVLNGMHSRDSRDFILFRKNLATARLYFKRELNRSSPRLKDEWFPYLIALELGPNIDKWFKAFPPPVAATSSFSDYFSTSTASNNGSSHDSWTGGGGSFGGAGASGSWATVASDLASVVYAPTSSSGSDGGGGSSGGGGGGGW